MTIRTTEVMYIERVITVITATKQKIPLYTTTPLEKQYQQRAI